MDSTRRKFNPYPHSFRMPSQVQSKPETRETDMDALNKAIDTLSEETLRSVFRMICASSAEAREQATLKLLVESTERRAGESDKVVNSVEKTPFEMRLEEQLAELTKKKDAKSDSDKDSGPEPKPNEPEAPTTTSQGQRPDLKRPVPRYSFCKNCKAEFDVTENTEKSCRYHPDPEPEPTGEDLWVDNEFGIEDSPSLRESYPDSWEFACCESTLATNPEGCEIDWHVKGPREREKKRYRS